jgi:hypothetical protein
MSGNSTGRGIGAQRVALGISLALLGMLFALPALAHPPKALILAYDVASGLLTVRISHPTPTPASHYIERVEVKREGLPLLVERYANQAGQAPLTYTYRVGPPTGALLEVTAACNLYGSRTVTLDWSRLGTRTP